MTTKQKFKEIAFAPKRVVGAGMTIVAHNHGARKVARGDEILVVMEIDGKVKTHVVEMIEKNTCRSTLEALAKALVTRLANDFHGALIEGLESVPYRVEFPGRTAPNVTVVVASDKKALRM